MWCRCVCESPSFKGHINFFAKLYVCVSVSVSECVCVCCVCCVCAVCECGVCGE